MTRNKVLDGPRMSELRKLGLDVSDASAYVYSGSAGTGYDLRWKKGNGKLNTGSYLVYTLEDILLKLPTQIKYQGYDFDLVIGSGYLMYFDWNQGRTLVEIRSTQLIDAGYEMLKWCLINKHL